MASTSPIAREKPVKETLYDFCKRYQVIIYEEPQLLFPHSSAWLIKDASGKQWVVKTKSPQDSIVELLNSFSMLHPPFHFTKPVSDPDDLYFLYPYLDGEALLGGPFEDSSIIGRVIELTGRLQALLRSLILVPFYQQTLRSKEFVGNLNSEVSRFDLGGIQRMDERQKSARHKETAQSYQWTEKSLADCCEILASQVFWPMALLHQFRKRVRNRFSIHLPITGSNLAHTALQPEHILVCPDGNLGVVGWHIEPRPRFYMIYTYLAWSFMHSKQQSTKEFYKRYLDLNSSKAFYEEHHLVFAICLVEQAAKSIEASAAGQSNLPAQRLQEVKELFKECLDRLS